VKAIFFAVRVENWNRRQKIWRRDTGRSDFSIYTVWTSGFLLLLLPLKHGQLILWLTTLSFGSILSTLSDKVHESEFSASVFVATNQCLYQVTFHWWSICWGAQINDVKSSWWLIPEIQHEIQTLVNIARVYIYILLLTPRYRMIFYPPAILRNRALPCFFFIGTSPIKAWYSNMAGSKKNKHHLIEWKHNSDIYLDNFGYVYLSGYQGLYLYHP
jgi:hypothetical protein